jgi:uncharacterized protein YbjT (DUF2867 family)
MQYVITGSLGHVGKPLVEKLTAAGHLVTAVSRKAERAAAIEALGASAAIGTVEDAAFLAQTFTGADAVFTLVPPQPGSADWKHYIAGIGDNYAAAIRSSGVRNVVNLSSIGAHMPEGCGPVSGLHFVEKALNALDGVNVLHLRPGYFYTNFLASIGTIRETGAMGGNYGPDTTLVLAHPSDIADAASEEMTKLSFRAKSIRYIASDEKTTHEIAAILGKAIGKPDLQWVDHTDEENLSDMLKVGMPEEIARNYVEMGAAMRSGEMASEYLAHRPALSGKIRFEKFGPVFAAAFGLP